MSETEERAKKAAAPLEVRLNQLLAGRTDITIAVAESCSGGGIASHITTVAGSSDYFLGSAVTYSNEAKTTVLGVPKAVLDSVGAVSEQCARAMAEGARRLFSSTLAVSTTGIAGPGGATARKPVGLVYIALSTPERTICEEHHFDGDRSAVVASAIQSALELVVAAAQRALDNVESSNNEST